MREALLQRAYQFGVKGKEQDLRGGCPCGGEFRRQGGDDLDAAFQLDVELFPGRQGREDVFQRRDRLAGEGLAFPGADLQGAQLRQRRLRDHQVNRRGAAGAVVMQADDPAVAGQAEVRLDAVCPLFEGEPEGSEGVLGSLAGGAAVADDERVAGHAFSSRRVVLRCSLAYLSRYQKSIGS